MVWIICVFIGVIILASNIFPEHIWSWFVSAGIASAIMLVFVLLDLTNPIYIMIAVLGVILCLMVLVKWITGQLK